MPVKRANPYAAYNFLVEIDSVVSAAFTEATGLGMEITYIDYRTGADPSNVRKLPGLRKFSDVTLKRGITGSTELFDWLKGAAEGQPSQRSVAIILMDEQRNPVIRWLLHRAQPQKWSGPHLNAAAPGAIAIEELVITHEGLEML